MKDLYVGYPNLPNNDALYMALDSIMASHRLTNNGPYVRELEERMAEFLDVEYAIAVCNATIGLQVVARALELEGKVLMPAWTFVATAHAMEWIGLQPTFCDVKLSHEIDPHQVEMLVGNDTAAILGVHLWGNACLCEALDVHARMNDIALFYDAAHAFGCTYKDVGIGNYGDAAVFSLHATKCINAFEGGLIMTNDEALANACRQMRNFGFVGYDDVRSTGTNGKMSEIHAAQGLAMLDCYDSVVKANERNFDLYYDTLSPLPGVFVLCPDRNQDHNYHYVVIEIDEAATGIHRDTVLAHLHEHSVWARRYFYPGVHQMTPYNAASRPLPITEKLAERTLVLPTGPSITPEDVEHVCKLVKEAVCKSSF